MGDKAMTSVLESMGRAARQGRSQRYESKLKKKDPTLEIGEVTLEPTEPKLSEQDLKDLEELDVQH
jgi:hypothetical protein